MAEKKVGIIGAGLGGLAASIRLAVSGYDVTVFEQNRKAGGKAGQFFKNGFRFDTGPSLLTMPFVLQELFEYAGEKIEDYINLERPEIICKYFYSDGTVINAYSDTDKFAGEIENKTADDKNSVKEYLNYCRRIYELTADLFLYKSFSGSSAFFNRKVLRALLNLKKIDTGRTMHEANSSSFNDRKTIQLFDRYATYNGSNPYETPATLNIIQHIEYNTGGFISKEGIYAIPEALYKTAVKKGAAFNFNSPVEKIVTENNRVTGIKSGGVFHPFDIVISNSDVLFTYKNLLKNNKSGTAKRYLKMTPSSSAIVFYWGVKGIHENLQIHNIIFSDDYKKEFYDLFDKRTIPSDPTIYIYISSHFKKDDAPEGNENWFVMINVPFNTGRTSEEEINKVRDLIKSKIKSVLKINLNKKIVTEEILTPGLIEKRTSSTAGSIYGISSNNKTAAFLRQKNRSSIYKGLYFCGGSAHPGGGIPLVLLSGKITSELINKYERK